MTYQEVLQVLAEIEAQRLIRGEGTETPIGLLPMSEATKIVAVDLAKAVERARYVVDPMEQALG